MTKNNKSNKKPRKDKGKLCPARGTRYTCQDKLSLYEFWIDQFDPKQISEDLGIPIQTVEKILMYQRNYEKNIII